MTFTGGKYQFKLKLSPKVAILHCISGLNWDRKACCTSKEAEFYAEHKLVYDQNSSDEGENDQLKYKIALLSLISGFGWDKKPCSISNDAEFHAEHLLDYDQNSSDNFRRVNIVN